MYVFSTFITFLMQGRNCACMLHNKECYTILVNMTGSPTGYFADGLQNKTWRYFTHVLYAFIQPRTQPECHVEMIELEKRTTCWRSFSACPRVRITYEIAILQPRIIAHNLNAVAYHMCYACTAWDQSMKFDNMCWWIDVYLVTKRSILSSKICGWDVFQREHLVPCFSFCDVPYLRSPHSHGP